MVWTPSGWVDKQINYAPLAAAVTLAANTEYYLASQEVSAGDQWYDYDTTVTTTSVAGVLSTIYSADTITWTPFSTANHTFGPVSLQYCGGTQPSVVTVTATDPTAGEPATGQGTGTFTFSRTGSTAAALTANFTVSGTATSGSDYTSIGTTVAFAAGSATAAKTVTGARECKNLG